jgi:GT2 family glycosyltransferase
MDELQPLVYAVILNWNRPDDTRACLDSLALADYPRLKMLVVDNGSDHEQAQALRVQEFGAEVLWLDRNYGFAEGNNRGMKYALEHGADLVLLLNNDTTVDPHMVSELVRVAQGDACVGIAGPIIYYADAPDSVWFAGMRFRTGLYVVRRGLHLKPPLSPAEEVDFISGCGMLIHRSVLESVGFLSSDYFMYYEDLDYCVRAQRAGFKLVCATQARMWHAVSSSTGGKDSPLKQYYQVKSSLIFYRQHTRGIMYLVNVALRFGHAAWVSLITILRGKLRREAVCYYLKGIREAMAHDSTRRVEN